MTAYRNRTLKSRTASIAVLMETSRSFGRGVIRGIVQYARVHDPWLFYIRHSDINVTLPPHTVWNGDGVIGRVPSLRMANEIQQRNLRLVCMGGPDAVQPRLVGTSTVSVCRAALTHLIERGFTRFAAAGGRGVWHSQRLTLFAALAKEGGHPCEIFQHQRTITHQQHADELNRLAKWLAKLPKPIGVFAGDDAYGRFLLDASHLARVHVPEELAVVGVDNDELVCEMATPPLSSVVLNAERIGFEAAGLMHEMLRGKRPRRWIEVEPLGVVARQSTDVLAIADADVAKAVRYIRERACQGITAADVMQQVACSERTLQLKFQRYLGRTPYQEVRRVRLERAKHLLLHSDQKLKYVADAVGLRNAQHLFVMFKEELAMTPNEYRRMQRAVGSVNSQPKFTAHKLKKRLRAGDAAS